MVNLKTGLKGYREIYGKDIDSIAGCVRLLRKIYESVPKSKKAGIRLNEAFLFIDERYQQLLVRARNTGRVVDLKEIEKYEKLSDLVEGFTEARIYSYKRLEHFRNDKDRTEQNNGVRDRRKELGRTVHNIIPTHALEGMAEDFVNPLA